MYSVSSGLADHFFERSLFKEVLFSQLKWAHGLAATREAGIFVTRAADDNSFTCAALLSAKSY